MVSAVERLAQVIPLNIEEIFLWYFEQKGVENPERFLTQGINGVNNEAGVKGNQASPSPLVGEGAAAGVTPLHSLPMGEGLNPQGQISESNLNPANQLSNLPPQNNLPQNLSPQESNQSMGISAETILQLVSILGKLKGLKNKSKKNNFLTMLLESIK